SAYGPAKPVWSFTRPNKTEFSAPLLSGAQRLPNGNTLICNGLTGTIFEVTRDKKIVWGQTTTALAATGLLGLGPLPSRPGAAPRPQGVLDSQARGALKLTPGQNRDFDELQHEVDAQLDKILTEGQKARLREMDDARAGGLGDGAAPGRILSLS